MKTKMLLIAVGLMGVSLSANARVTALGDSRARIAVALDAVDSLVGGSPAITKVSVHDSYVKIEFADHDSCFALRVILRDTNPVLPTYVADGHQRDQCE